MHLSCTFIQIFYQHCAFFNEWHQNCHVCLIQRQNSRYFWLSGLKDEKLIKKYKPTRKLKHTNSILQSFEYFCQISSNLILIIFSYLPFQNWCIFLRHSVETVVSLVTCQPQLTSMPIAEFFVEKVDEVCVMRVM